MLLDDGSELHNLKSDQLIQIDNINYKGNAPDLMSLITLLSGIRSTDRNLGRANDVEIHLVQYASRECPVLSSRQQALLASKSARRLRNKLIQMRTRCGKLTKKDVKEIITEELTTLTIILHAVSRLSKRNKLKTYKQ